MRDDATHPHPCGPRSCHPNQHDRCLAQGLTRFRPLRSPLAKPADPVSHGMRRELR